MNRFTTVLYPSIPSSASDVSASSVGHHSRDSPALVSPADSNFPSSIHNHINAPLDGGGSIYDDPRSPRYTSPPPRGRTDTKANNANGNGTGNSAAAAGPSSLSSLRPTMLRRVTDEGGNGRSGSSTPTPRAIHPAVDRSFRVNLMHVGTSQAHSKRGGRPNTPVPSGGRLSSMAHGPKGRYVVGGGQYLRVLEVSVPPDPSTQDSLVSDTPNRPQIRPAGPPFVRGPGGVTVSEVVNLWKGSWAIGKGVNDVDWGVSTFESKIVTATPSGNFMIFDVNRGKLDREVGGGHPRPMNCIRTCKTPQYAHLLLTGGTEGQARLWDLRENEPVNRKYYKHNAPVTALAFCPDDPHQFVVGTDTGGLFRYDYRLPNKAVGKAWGAHGSKPVLDLKWKGSDGDEYVASGSGWLASAGGDRTVQVWDMSHSWDKHATPTHVLHTAYPLRRVSWRPNHPTELAVVPLNQPIASATLEPTRPTKSKPDLSLDDTDAHLEVWDVRRHYVAKYSLPGSSDGNAVDAIWDDADSLIACYQNGGFAQIDLRSKMAAKTVPLESLPRQVVAWSVKGELAYALDRFKQGEIPFDDLKAEYASHWGQVGRLHKGIADHPFEPAQATGILPFEENDETEFTYLAHQYRIEGDTPERLCQWNREIAEVCGREDDARLWDLLQGLIEEFAPSPSGLFNEAVFSQAMVSSSKTYNPPSPRGENNNRRLSLTTPTYGTARAIALQEVDNIVASDSETETDDSVSESSDPDGPPAPRRTRFKAFVSPSTTAVRPSGPRRNDSSFTNVASMNASLSQAILSRSIRKVPQESPSSDETQTPIAEMDYPDPYGIATATFDSEPTSRVNGTKSSSAASGTHSPTPGRLDRSTAARVSLNDSTPSGRHSLVGQLKDRLQPSALTRQTKTAVGAEDWSLYRKFRCQVLLDWWRSYVEDGDVQLATIVFLVGSSVVQFPRKQMERVIDAYLDLLERHHLSVPAGYLRRFGGIPAIQTMPGQDGITHILHCTRCGKSTGSLEDTPDTKRFWWCKKCIQASKKCSVCREPVKGLWMGCSKCHHGGHQRCMRVYYLETEIAGSQHPTPATTAQSMTRGRSPTPPPRRSSVLTGPGPSSSHDSSGIVDRSRKSSELSRGPGSASELTSDGGRGGRGDGDMFASSNVCPSGCGCRCRTVRGERGG